MAEADLPERPDARERPRVGVDEWVAQVEGRRERAAGLSGLVLTIWERLPPFGRLAVFVVPAAFFPVFTGSNTLSRFGVFTLLYVLLGLGLNIVVGFAGLLDLGYVDLTGGANGLDRIDPLDFFGYKLTTTKQDFYFLLGAFVVVVTALYFANESRTGRAWRALR